MKVGTILAMLSQTCYWPEPIWQTTFELAWESLRTGSRPIGAAIVGPTGELVAVGRNRRHESSAPEGQLRGVAIAHAEMNVLAQLAPESYADHTLYTTLEPCLLCTAGLRIARVGTVAFAGADPVWGGAADIPQILKPRAAKNWTKRTGPLPGPLGLWGAVLPAYWMLEHNPGALAAGDLIEPHIVALAERLRTTSVFAEATVTAALDRAWPELAESVNAAESPTASAEAD